MVDTILMCRFWPALRGRLERVVALVQPPLARLLADGFPEIEVVTTLDGIRYGPWCATMSLPWSLDVDSVERVPREPWIRLSESTSEDSPAAGEAAQGRDGPLRVGLDWAGNPKFALDAVRSTHLTASVIHDLDLVVSTETATPNLSAAMGVPTCALARPDWDHCWTHGSPNVTVCAQECPDEWTSVCVRTLEVIRDAMVRRQGQEERAA